MTTITKSKRVQAKPEPTRDVPRSSLVGLWDWRRSNGHLFVSDTALRWFLRKHRDRFIEAGALFLVNGRQQVDPEKFEPVLREIGIEEARRASEEAA
ncbi:MAG: hypothetical protein IT515_08050 [Burkholderiales bacterium]|nr:hypothetical protein [Burkholderiales bacterium]